MRAVTQNRSSDRVEFAVDGLPLTTYVFGDPVAERPYFYPLRGADGEYLTRRFPVETTQPDEPTDHPHHRSLWSGHGSVNGHDNWNARPHHAWTRFRHLEQMTAPDTLVAHSDYTDAGDTLLCHERLAVRVVPQENGACLIDWHVTLTAPANAPVVLGDTKEVGLCAVRVAAPLQGDRGGRIENAESGVGEAECWGRASRWCDYSGQLTPGGPTVGIAILSHPDSFRHPTYWHVRAYGLFAANPFALHEFTHGAANGEITLAPGESVVGHYAVVTHRGDAAGAGIEAIWRGWAGA